MDQSQFLSIQDAADYLGVDYKTIYRLVRAGSLPASKIGGMYRIQRDRLEGYIQAQTVQGAGREREGKGATAPDRIKCSHCFRLIVAGQDIGGRCSGEGCGQPICRQCWEAGHRYCAEHQPSDRERLARAQAALARGEIRCLVTAIAARQAEQAWIARFDERIQGIGTLYHPGTREVLRISDWSPHHIVEDETLQLMQLLNVGFLDKVAQATLPHNDRSTYSIEAGKLGWGRPQRAILLEARCVSHLEAYVEQGYDTGPADVEELALHLTVLEERANTASATSIAGLGSPTGWDEAAIKQIIDEEGRAYRHPLVMPFLIDLGTGTVYHNQADERTAQFRYADLFRLPVEAEEAAMLRPQIEALLLGRDGLPVSELARSLGRPEALVQRASEALAAGGRYKLLKDSDLGLVLVRNRD